MNFKYRGLTLFLQPLDCFSFLTRSHCPSNRRNLSLTLWIDPFALAAVRLFATEIRLSRHAVPRSHLLLM
jgi:hypothetical protein